MEDSTCSSLSTTESSESDTESCSFNSHSEEELTGEIQPYMFEPTHVQESTEDIVVIEEELESTSASRLENLEW